MNHELKEKPGNPQERKRLFVPIGFKMITITSLIVIASLAGVALAASFFFRSDNEARAMEETLTNSTLISQKVKTDLLSIAEKSKAALMSANAAGRGAEAADDFFQRNPDIYYIAAMVNGDNTPRGEMINAGWKSSEKLDFRQLVSVNKDILQLTFKGEETLFNPSAYLNDAVVGMAVPFAIINGKESIMVVLFSMDKVLESMKALGVIKNFMVSGSGEVIAHYDPIIARSKTNLSSLPIVQMMITGANPNGQTSFRDVNGESFLGAYSRTGFTDGAVISAVPEKKAFESVYKIQKIILFITLIALSAAVIFIYLFSKAITGPLSSLMAAANSIRKGDFFVTVEAKTNDEIGRLSDSFTEMAKGLGEREKMKDAFGRFVNKEIADLVLRDEIKLGGERKEVAVFFSDIRAFTEISEKLQPEQVVEFLNGYMTQMVRCVNEHKGVVDKFIGDAIMAVWGAPFSHGNDTENAINSALMMRRVLMAYNKERGASNRPMIRIGVGINTGPVLAGQIGCDERMEYTVIGDAVNLASRIEALNKPFGTDILISSDAYEKVRHIFNVEPMRKIKVKGKSEAQRIFAVIGRKDDPSAPKNLYEVRMLCGIKPPPPLKISERDSVHEEKEKKYEIVE